MEVDEGGAPELQKISLSKDDLVASIPEDSFIYAVLDASVIPGLYERFASDDLEAHCLFKGDTAEDMRDVAPYLVRLDAQSSLLAELMKSGDKPWELWNKRPGLFFYSQTDAAILVKHLRRFLRVQHGEKSFFFRFWEPSPMIAYFDAIASDPDKWRRWFSPHGGGDIEAFIVPDLRPQTLRVFEAGALLGGSRLPTGRFALSDTEMQALMDAKIHDDLWEMEILMRKTFPDATQELSDDGLNNALRRSLSRMASFGIRQRSHVFRVAAWDLHSDGRFEITDPDGQLSRILDLPTGETEKMRRLSERLAELP